jgi:hypothetical protein
MRPRTRFRRYRGRRVPFECFGRPNSFSTVPRASRFHVMRPRTRFRRYRGRRVPFSYFARADSFSTVPRASDPVLMFCPPGLVFGGTEGVRSRFHVLRAQTRFRRYRGCRFPFSCYARPDSFSAVPRASGPVFMFCARGLVFGGTEGVGSRFNVLRARTRFRWYRGRRVPFPCYAHPDAFLAVTRATGPVFMLCARGRVFGDNEGVGSRFHVLRSRTNFRW